MRLTRDTLAMTVWSPWSQTIAALVVLFGTRLGCGGPDPRVAQTKDRLRAIDAGLTFFQQSRGTLPREPGEVCRAEPRWYLLYPDTLWTSDAWGTTIRYEPRGVSYVLRSAGADRIFGTADDIRFDAALDRSWAERLAGCYETGDGKLDFGRVELVPEVASGGGYRIEQPRQINGRPISLARWYPLSPDSLLAVWIHADQSAALTARVDSGGLVGRLGRHPIAAAKVAC